MRIGINALYLLPGEVGGTEIFIRNVVGSLAEAAPDNEYLVFVNRESRGVFDDVAPNVRPVECPFNASSRPARILWEQLVLPFQLRRHRIDVLYSAGMTGPFVTGIPQLVVIYDLQHVNQPRNFSFVQRFFLRTIIYLSARAADAVITISTHVKRDIEEKYRIPPERIFVTYCAADLESFRPAPAEEVARVREKYDLPERYILYIASSLPHKNYRRLLEAFREVKKKDPGVKLVLIGARAYGSEAITSAIDGLGIADDVVFLGWLPFEDLPPIYSAATLFVFPSLHEGFGIPVIEAMACAVPVVCSGIEPLVEVAGGAARLVNPESVESMAEGMLEVLGDEELGRGLTREGLERAKFFSWRKTAEETLEVLGRYAAGGGSRG